jgi:hypothetical protein
MEELIRTASSQCLRVVRIPTCYRNGGVSVSVSKLRKRGRAPTLDDGQDKHELVYTVVSKGVGVTSKIEARTTMSMVMNISLRHPNMYSSSPNTCR